MTTFDIDNTKKTKHLEVLESLVEQGHALRATHNPQTWRLSALTFALHINDCIILFSRLKDKWAERLPLSEAWDVDFTEWKTRIWSLVNNVSSFTEDQEFSNWQRLCEADYQTFIVKANECLSGELPLKELTSFLSEKNTELKKVIIDSGQDLSTLFSDTESMLYNTPPGLYESFYDDLVSIYMNENETPFQIEENGLPVAYERWKASKSKKRLPDLILSKIKSINAGMLEIKFWQETWSECFDIERREIEKEGFARFIFQNRKGIIESKTYPCKNCLGRCLASLCLCEHLWLEYNRVEHPETIVTFPSEAHQDILHQLFSYTEKGDWVRGMSVKIINNFILTILDANDVRLEGEDAVLSEKMWVLMERGTGDRVKIVWQNLVGYLDDKKLFKQKGSPALNKDFFDNDVNYTNIDKGRPSRNNMSNGFRKVLPLLDKYCPKLDKKV